ncbi:tripartite motif-containing protein 2-like [Branchiostoma lanceolatum]|uniref:tripartite motif-containing protein 2-like n=1 Tax=Branchiostoma lanceolatum TaxID=7740 RepID=UPI003452631A
MAVGGADRESLHSLEDLLLCGICLDDFKTPKLLPCGHTFCEKCLENFAKRGRTFCCPNCRRKIDLPHGGIKALPGNFWIGGMRDLLMATKKDDDRRRGGFHEKCLLHKEEELRYFCLDCERMICAECMVDEHSGHRVSRLKEILAQKLEEAKTLENNTRSIVNSILAQLQDLANDEGGLVRQVDGERAEIHAAAQVALKMIESQKSNLLKQLESEFAVQRSIIFEDKQRLENDLAKLLGAMDSIQEARQTQAIVHLITTIRHLTEYMHMRSRRPVRLPLGTSIQFLPTKLGKEVKLGDIFTATDSFCSSDKEPDNSQDFEPEKLVSLEPSPVVEKDGTVVPGSPHVVVVPGTPLSPRGTFPRKIQFGRRGTAEGEFEFPFSVAVRDGYVYVLDKSLRTTVQVFDFIGTFFRSFELLGLKANSGGLIVDKDGQVTFVGNAGPMHQSPTDTEKNTNMIYTHSADGLSASRKKLSIGYDMIQDAAEMPDEEGFAVAMKGTIVILDKSGQQVVRFSTKVGAKRVALTVSQHNGDVILSLFYESKVKVFDSKGTLRVEFGSKGSGDGQFGQPTGLCVDKEGNIIVADKWNRRVQLFDRDGRFLKVIASAADGLEAPIAVAVGWDGLDGRVAVTDTDKYCIFVFKY